MFGVFCTEDGAFYAMFGASCFNIAVRNANFAAFYANRDVFNTDHTDQDLNCLNYSPF